LSNPASTRLRRRSVTGSREQLTGLIEIIAEIQAGDSGGPLLTTSGQVLGVNTAASAGFPYQATGGHGFAIPIATATKITDPIRTGESSSTVHIGATAYLGIETPTEAATTPVRPDRWSSAWSPARPPTPQASPAAT
jgi:S1-C subfamily serine protease